MRNEDFWGLGGIGGSPGIRLGLVILLCGSNGFAESGFTHAQWDVECDGINMKKSTDPISRGAKLLKPSIVKRPNGGCQILFPLSELDYLLRKLRKAMELPKSLMEEQKNRKANNAVCGPKPSAGLGTQDGLVGETIQEDNK